MILSENLRALKIRVQYLKSSFLPPISQTGQYTTLEQDQMRAFRMLAHAEIEHYLESVSEVFIKDLENDICNARNCGMAKLTWAKGALRESKVAKSSNNGIKKEDIIKMFSPFGFSESFFDAVSPVFLDRMSTYGKDRGDVAHNSALRASRDLNCQREGAFINELLEYLEGFDNLIFMQRMRFFLHE